MEKQYSHQYDDFTKQTDHAFDEDDVEPLLDPHLIRSYHREALSQQRGKAFWNVLLILTAALLIYCAIILSILLRTVQQDSDAQPCSNDANLGVESANSGAAIHHCGSSVAEAKAKNCHFDPMTWDWYPQACADPELSAEAVDSYEWEYYTHQSGKADDLVPIADVIAAKYSSLWVPMEYHFRHCTYLWRKMHRTILLHKMLDNDTAVYEHTKHCEEVLLGNIDRSIINTKVTMAFKSCIAL